MNMKEEEERRRLEFIRVSLRLGHSVMMTTQARTAYDSGETEVGSLNHFE